MNRGRAQQSPRATTPIPEDPSFDSTLALLREGYLFIPRRCRRFATDIFSARLMGEKAIWISGEAAAEVFYDGERFQRTGAVPRRIRKTLFGDGGVQTLDDAAHRHRKAMLLSLLSPERLGDLGDLNEQFWRAALDRWTEADRVVLFPEVEDILCRTACAWAGVPLDESEARRRARQFGALVDAFGGVGLRHWRGRLARRSLERWIGGLIAQVRAETLSPARKTALRVIAEHVEPGGSPLDTRTAAVELINLIRPIVAVARYITFAALALHEYPRARELVREGTENHAVLFAHEVRRFYPFAPFVGARVRKDFVWRDHAFRRGTLVLLDIYGTNRDPRRWERPDDFLPERFMQRTASPFDFIPQGGGDPDTGHRCAGEAATVELMKIGILYLTRHMEYEVPAQDLGFDLTRMPTLPRSGFVIHRVRSNLIELVSPVADDPLGTSARRP
ncbi:cytochrome P450 [Nannocystis exedens]|nr:cytochrome P450 [Nannocystis exedens]